MGKLTHIDENDKPAMVDVSGKDKVLRKAVAEGKIYLEKNTLDLIKNNKIRKGNVLTVAEIAGVMGGKKTSDMIPLCHNIVIDKIAVNALLEEDGIRIKGEAVCKGKTGIEMEVLTAVSIGLLTVYDMCKAVDKNMCIGDIKLISKTKEKN